MWYLWGIGEVPIVFQWGNVRKKRKLGRPRLRWDASIKMDVQEI